MKVLAYERGETILFNSLGDCALCYGYADKYALVKAIILGTTAPTDGYTTFDFPATESDTKVRELERTAMRRYSIRPRNELPPELAGRLPC